MPNPKENAMTLPVHIPNEAPKVQAVHDARSRDVTYRLLVDADGGPSSDLTQGIFYLDAGDSESRHTHDVTETLYILKGKGRAKLGDRTLELNEGDTLFIPAGLPHEFEADEALQMHFTFPVDRFADVTYTFDEAA